MKVSLVIPVYNESAQLAASISKLLAQFAEEPRFSLEITIADNGSTDGTTSIAHQLVRQHPMLRHLALREKGRGRALKHAWLSSDADVLAYMDVDLSSDISSFPDLLKPLFDGTADLCVGSRLLIPEWTQRGWKREFLSRGYNRLLQIVFGHQFSDAQCGFKAITRAAAQELLPLVESPSWFFDTELLLIAEHLGYRIQDLPVRWRDDPDSRVSIVQTVVEDLRGIVRLRMRFPLKVQQQSDARDIPDSAALTAVAIATYPPADFGPRDEGVGNYNRSKYLALAENYGSAWQCIVLANASVDERALGQDGKLQIMRCWRRGSVWAVFRIATELSRLPSARTLYVELEMRMFGSWCGLALLPLLLSFARLRGQRTIVTLHQVVLSPEIIRRQFGLATTSRLWPCILYGGLWSYYLLLSLVSNAFIVHERELALRGVKFITRRWNIVPHGVQPVSRLATPAITAAKGQAILLCFGSLVWYKGLTRLLDFYQQLLRNWSESAPAPLLVIAGGPSPHELGNAVYLRQVEAEMERACSLGATVTGFLPPSQIADYFAAADVCLFPYSAFFAASGPFALALGFARPFLLSKELAPLLGTDDIREGLSAAGFTEADFVFDSASDLARLIKRSIIEKERRETLSREIGLARSWEKIAGKMLNLANR